MRRPSLLFVSLMNGAPWGGSEELWYRCALRAAAQGHEVGCAVYAWDERRARLEALRQAGARVLELPNHGHLKRHLLDTALFELWTPQRRRAVLSSFPFERYDAAVVNQGGWQDVARAEWRHVPRRLPPYALLFHNYDQELRITPRRGARLSAWIAGASANLFAADPIRAGLEAKLGLTVPNPSVLLNPVGFEPPERPLAPAAGPPWRFAMLAALDVARKGQDALVQALARPEWKERPFVLSLHGAGQDEGRLRELVQASGLEGKVRLEGHATDVLAALRRAHVVLQLTRIDAMPISVVEAMAAGRPVAATSVGDLPAWVRPGENGWLCPAATPGAIAATLEEVWASRHAWAAMGERAHRTFRERCPVPAEERLLELLRAVVRRPPAA